MFSVKSSPSSLQHISAPSLAHISSFLSFNLLTPLFYFSTTCRGNLYIGGFNRGERGAQIFMDSHLLRLPSAIQQTCNRFLPCSSTPSCSTLLLPAYSKVPRYTFWHAMQACFEQYFPFLCSFKGCFLLQA